MLCNYNVVYIFLLITAMGGSSCVSPPEHADGLLENLPAIVNETDYFSLSILGDTYSKNESWNLNFSATESDMVLTTLVLKDINVKATDSTYFRIIRADGDTILNFLIQSDFISSSKDSILSMGVPAIVSFTSVNFTGRLEHQLLKINN